MKNQIEFIKTSVVDVAYYAVSLSLVLMLVFSSCSSNTKPEDTKEVASEHNEAKFDNVKAEDDAKFLVSAAEINLEEIQLGQLAQSKGTIAEVKDLGKMMESEHNKALIDLKALADKKQITIPTTITDDGQQSYKKLDDKKGNEFNKAYCDMMVDGHKDAIEKFEKASMDAADPDIKEWAATMLPALRTHLDNAINCQKKCEKM